MRACSIAAVISLLLVILGATELSAQSQTGKLSAREIFYSAPKAAAAQVEKTQSAAKEVAAKKPARPNTPAVSAPEDTQSAAQPSDIEYAAAPAKPAPTAAPVPSPTGDNEYAAVPSKPVTRPEETQFVAVSNISEPLVPLGLRYSILRSLGPGDNVEVDSNVTFRAGDRIRLRVDVNDSGYLYIIHRGSSGIWKPLFPSPEIAGGDNVVRKGVSYDIPQGYVFTFDEQAGEEKLFVVFSRQPEQDLEKLVYDLSSSEGKAPAPEPVAPAPEEKMMLAQNIISIDDSLVNNLRKVYARDLIIEQVDETTPGPRQETAVYVVNTSATQDSRVVADISLNHK